MIDEVMAVFDEIPKPLEVLFITAVIGILVTGTIKLIIGNEAYDQIEKAKEIKEDTMQGIDDTTLSTGFVVADEIHNSFDEMGKKMSKDIKDPELRNTLQKNMSFVGLLLAFLIIIIFLNAILNFRKF